MTEEEIVAVTATAIKEIGVELKRIRQCLQVGNAGTELHTHVARMQRRLETLHHALIDAFGNWRIQEGMADDLLVVLNDWEAAKLWWI